MNTPNNQNIPEVVSINQMTRLLNISRSRLYGLMNEGILLYPVYSLSKRPFFTREMAERNLEAKKNNRGINGRVVVYYSSRLTSVHKVYRSAPTQKQKSSTNERFENLIKSLESLGLKDITDPQIGSAIHQCFPDGTQNVDEDEVLISVFRHLKAHNSRDNLGR